VATSDAVIANATPTLFNSSRITFESSARTLLDGSDGNASDGIIA